MLRTPETFRLFGGVEERHGTVGPDEAALGWLEEGAFPRRANCEEAALALDHDVPNVGGRWADQGYAFTSGGDLGAHPLGASAGLAEAASC